MKQNNLIIFDFDGTLYDRQKQELIPGAREFLRDYSGSYALALISRQENRRSKLIEGLGIKAYFSLIRLREKKEVSDFVDCMEALYANKNTTWSIGDNLEDEIALSKSAGIRTVLLRNESAYPSSLFNERNVMARNYEDIRRIVPLKICNGS